MQLLDKVRAILSLLSRLPGYITSTFDKLAPWVFVCVLAAAMLFDPGRDTLQTSSAAFAIAVALASVTFSYGRTLKEVSAVRDELIFAGERLVSGAAAFLIASILRHASRDVPRYMNTLRSKVQYDEQYIDLSYGDSLFASILSVLAYVACLVGLVYAQMGLRIVMAIVNHRTKRRPGHDKFFLSATSIERHVADLDATDQGQPPNR